MGKRFADMNQDELFLSAHKLLISIHTMTGWTLPEAEFLDSLENNFEKKLMESYSNLNVEEIEYAFRNRDASVKDWGKALNFSLIDEIVIPYLEKRFELSKLEEQENNRKNYLQLENKSEVEPIDMIEWIEEYRKSENINRELIPLCFYDFLSETTLEVTKEMKWEAMAKSSQSIKSELLMNATEKPSVDNARDLKEFELGEKEGFTGVLKERILNRAKRMIVYDYLTKK